MLRPPVLTRDEGQGVCSEFTTSFCSRYFIGSCATTWPVHTANKEAQINMKTKSRSAARTSNSFSFGFIKIERHRISVIFITAGVDFVLHIAQTILKYIQYFVLLCFID